MEHPFNQDLQEALDSQTAYDFLPNGTWVAGGCGLLAHALQTLIPGGTLVVVGRLDRGIADHLAYRVTDQGVPLYLDYNGVQTEPELLAYWATECPGVPLSIKPLSEAESEGLDTDNLYWLIEDAAALARHIRNEIGPCDLERVGLQWVDLEGDDADPIWADQSDTPTYGPSM